MANRNKVSFSLQEFHNKYLNDKHFNRLFNEWTRNKYQKQFKPSLDRISNKGIYSFENTHMITWAENRYKQSMERRSRKGKVFQMLGDKVVKIFKSQREAVLLTGISQGNMSEVLNNRRQTAGGYRWVYENHDLLNK